MKTQKLKGNSAERQAAALWREAGYPNARRRLTREEAREGDGRDLENTGWYIVQVKHGARPNPLEALAEIQHQIGHVAVAMVKRNRHPWVVCLSWDDFTKLLKGTYDPPRTFDGS